MSEQGDRHAGSQGKESPFLRNSRLAYGRRSEVPYFPFRIVPTDGEGFLIKHPVLMKHYTVNAHAREFLDLCDGFSAWDELIRKLNRKYGTSMRSLEDACASAIAPLERDGLLWWRSERMRPVTVGPPSFVLWNLTDKCNHRCLHCVLEAGGCLPDELSTVEALRLVDELTDLGVRMLVLSGGEPLLRADFIKIAGHAYRRGMRFQLATNATLITERLARELAAMEATSQVSLDGAFPHTHDEFRQCRGAWKRTVKGIRQLVKAGVHVMLASVVTKRNADEIRHIYRLASELGVNVYRILPFVPFGRGAQAKDLEVSPQRMKHITRWLHEQAQGGLAVAPMEFECLFSPPPGSVAEVPDSRIGCDGAVGYCTLTSSGDILPCNFFKGIRTHNIRNYSFQWIWNNDSFLQYFRSLTVRDIQGSCNRCAWLSACRGSCIAANFVHRNVFQSNCHCWYARELRRRGVNQK